MPDNNPSFGAYDSIKGQERTLYTIYLGLAVGLMALQAAALVAMRHPPICTCGYIDLWHGNPSGPETSQHLTDWYTYTHVIHGFGFYLLLRWIAPRKPLVLRLVIAIGLEASWELIENTPIIMDRYRQSALARGYFGDSVVNSVADTIAAVLRVRACPALAGMVERGAGDLTRAVRRVHDPGQSHSEYHPAHLSERGHLRVAVRRLI